MPIKYAISPERRMLLSVSSGKVPDADIQAQQESIANNPLFHPDFVQLWDTREAEPSGNKTDPDSVQFVGSPHTHRSVLVSSALMFGLGRQIELTRYDKHEGGMRIFSEMDEALSWIDRTQEDYDVMLNEADWIEIS